MLIKKESPDFSTIKKLIFLLSNVIGFDNNRLNYDFEIMCSILLKCSINIVSVRNSSLVLNKKNIN